MQNAPINTVQHNIKKASVPLKQEDLSPGTRNKILFLEVMICKQLISTCWLGLCKPWGHNFSNAAAPSFGWLAEGSSAGLKGNARQKEAGKTQNESLDPTFGTALL